MIEKDKELANGHIIMHYSKGPIEGALYANICKKCIGYTESMTALPTHIQFMDHIKLMVLLIRLL